MMKRQGYRLHVENSAFKHYAFNFFLLDHDDRGIEHGVRLVREEDPLDLRIRVDPTFQLAPDDAQNLMDDLWRAGLRPTEGRQSEGVTAAQNRHLEDMRKLTFSKLGVEMP